MTRTRFTFGHPARRNRFRIVTGIAAVAMIGIAILLATAGFFDRDAFHIFAPTGPRTPIGAVFFSGDMGLRYGMGSGTSAALAAHGIAGVGVSSPTLFGTRRSRAEVDAIVADAVRQGLAHTKSARVVLIGQSYGADILQTGLADLPADLRPKVAGVVLVVPGRTVFFRADPSEIVYHGTPDSLGLNTAPSITWTPVTCIYGVAESDSLCPLLHMPNLHVVGMPGGHFLAHDADGLSAQVIAAIDRAVPGAMSPQTLQPKSLQQKPLKRKPLKQKQGS